MSEYGDNVWGELEEMEKGVSGTRLVRTPGHRVAGAVWELAPGSKGVAFHFHHGTEEYLIVLRGRPTLRTTSGERRLEEGAVVHFPPGRDGAHSLTNPTDDVVRYVIVGAHTSPDIVEYLDDSTYAAVANTESQHGASFFVTGTLDAPAEEDRP
jgi:uncharacterized cupin superfamily protein